MIRVLTYIPFDYRLIYFLVKQCGPDWESIPKRAVVDVRNSVEAVGLKRRVQVAIDQFLKEGTIFRSADPIGGTFAYHVS